ncbi:MAG: orotidine-5'-phosphate decarboxylase [Methyloligellaceae bacterium]
MIKHAKDRLIVALDVPTPNDARKLIQELGGNVGVYKIGLELLFAGGVPLMEKLIETGHKVFVDAKLLDIGNTVERAVTNIARLGATFLTIHGTDRKTMDAAVKGRGNSDLKLLAITVLTNLQHNDLAEQGITMSGEKLVRHRAKMAEEAGFDGVVASGLEAAKIRSDCHPGFNIVTPGIRPEWADAGDQARIVTPAKAISQGADYIVIGRPITQAVDPLKATMMVIEEIESAVQKK